jgi:hypothetical protein
LEVAGRSTNLGRHGAFRSRVKIALDGTCLKHQAIQINTFEISFQSTNFDSIEVLPTEDCFSI